MKVALVFCAMDGSDPTSPSLSTSEHLGIGYLAASLRSRGHQVLVFNSEVRMASVEKTFGSLADFGPELVGCSPVSLSIKNTLALLEMIKAFDSKITTVLGGHLASMCATDIISCETCVDYIIKGDAEFSISKLVDRLGAIDPDQVYVPGLVYRDSRGQVRELEYDGFHQLDDYPVCHRDDLEVIAKTESFDKSARILASRGCFYKCSFCTTPHFYGEIVRFRDQRCVLQEMNLLNERFGISHFWFNDDLFVNGTPENTSWIDGFTQLLEENSVSFTYRILCRADSFRRKNQYLLDRMIATGLSHIFFGMESGSQFSLDIYNKKTTVAHNLAAVQLIKSKNVKLQIGFIMFNPYSSFSDLKESVQFLYEIGELYRLFPLTRQLSVFPGTAIAKRLEKDGLLLNNSFKEPLTCYVYRDEKVARFASMMNVFYEENSTDDRVLNRILNQTGSENERNELAKELSTINLVHFTALIGRFENDAISAKADERGYFKAWSMELAQVLKEKNF